MSGGTILKQFYDAVRRRDMAKARTYLDDNMTFAGLFETYPNANAYIATYTPAHANRDALGNENCAGVI